MVSAFPASIYSMNGVGGAVQLNVFPGTGAITTTPVYSIAGLPAYVTAQFADPSITAAALPYPLVTQGIGANSAGGSATHSNGLISMIGLTII